ncbi:hypothetical protein H4R19_001534 [Coemansia spiralis]|nr:hypothetical protein H4R19_001534 [Coemansia spiralis]
MMLVEKYPLLRTVRWLPGVLRSISKSNGIVFDERLLRSPQGRLLCLWCGVEMSGARGELFCPPPRRSSQSSSQDGEDYGEGCHHEHRLRRDNQYVRDQLLVRDGGVCAECGVDAHDLFAAAVRCGSVEERVAMFKQLARVNPDWHKKVRRPLTSIEYGFTESMFWEAAHLIDVKHGGGLCGLEGFRTLCVPCHAGEYARTYIQDLSNMSAYLSPPQAAAPVSPTSAPRPHTPSSEDRLVTVLDSSSSASTSPQMPSPSRCLDARPPRLSFETPTKPQRCSRPRTLSPPPSPHLAAIIDLTTSSSDDLPRYALDSELDALTSKLTMFTISSSEESSGDEIEVILAIASPPSAASKAEAAQIPASGNAVDDSRVAVPPV